MIAPCSVNVYDVLDCYCFHVRRNLDRDELGDEIAKINVDIMIMKPLLVDSVDSFGTIG